MVPLRSLHTPAGQLTRLCLKGGAHAASLLGVEHPCFHSAVNHDDRIHNLDTPEAFAALLCPQVPQEPWQQVLSVFQDGRLHLKVKKRYMSNFRSELSGHGKARPHWLACDFATGKAIRLADEHGHKHRIFSTETPYDVHMWQQRTLEDMLR